MEALYALNSPPVVSFTHRPLSSSFLGLPYRISKYNPKKELLMGPRGNVVQAVDAAMDHAMGLAEL